MRLLPACILLTVSAACLPAQDRIPRIAGGERVAALSGHRPAMARPEFDRGPANADTFVRRMSLIFRRTPAQQAELERLRTAQRTPGSPDYLRWLTPAEFADRFGMDRASLAHVREWLEAQGFVVDAEAVSRTWIAFSGTAAQVKGSFQTSLHKYE